MRRSTSAARRACAVGTTIALIGLSTGLGIMTATSASAVEADPTVSAPATTGDTASNGTSTDTTSGGTTSTDGTTPTDAGTSDPGTSDPGTSTTDSGSGTTDPGAGAGTTGSDAPTGGSTDTPAPGSTDTPAGGTGVPGAGTSSPTTPAATPADQPTKSSRAAAAQSVTIEGDLTVGSDLVAKQAGFTAGSAVSYVWTDATGTVLSESATYTIAKELAGKTITVTLVGTVAGETATRTTDTAVAPVFVDEDGQPISDEDDASNPYIEATAGEAFSYTFRAFSTPAPSLSITWSDDEGNETKTAPAGIRFDPKTGVLSGSLTKANEYYDFTVTATTAAASGTVSTDQYGEISVDPAAPVGIEVTSINKDALIAGTTTSAWIIHPNGDVYTEDLASDEPPVKGGKVSVPQGGTLLVAGSKVDRFGNEVYPGFEEDSDEPVFFTPTVTSDVSSDVIQRDPDLGEVGVVSVTFPHASTHTLTVSGASLPSTVFAVDVVPAAVPAVVPTPPVVPAAVTNHVGSGRLAYTGTDSTSALPWALGLVLAGVGIIGARTLRRRRAQR